MRGVRAWLLRLAGLVGAGRSDAEIREEVETHRSLLAAEYEQAGMLAEEARRRAAADLGSLSAISAAYQDRRGVPVIETTLRHFRMAARSLQRSSVASVSTVLVLGLGIGAATAVLAVFQAIAWGDLTVPSAGDVVRLSQRFDGVVDRRVQGQVDRFSYPEFEAYRVATRTLAGVAAVKHDRMVWRRDGEERPVRAAKVTGDYFRVLPVRPDIGRLLAPDDARNPGLFVIQPDANWDAATGSRPRDRGDFSWQLATVLASDSRVRAVTLVTLAPFAGTGHSRAAPGPDVPVAAVHFNDVDARYFETLDVPLVAGRSFLPGEADAVVVNSALARRFWGEDRSALDRLLYVPSRGTETMRPLRVVGVSPTLQTRDVGIPDEPTYYTLLTPRASGTSFVVLRAREGAPVRQLASDAAQGIAPGQSISVASLDDRLRASTGELRVALGVLAFLGALAVLVAAVGIHGLIAFTISARFREIGVCRTLGAAPTQVLRLILGWTMTGVTLGTIGAVILTVAASTLLGGELQGLLNGLSPLDPLSFLFAVSVLGLSVALATYLPARRALGIAPVAALRSE